MNDMLFTIADVLETPEGMAICGTSPLLDSLEDAEISSLLRGVIMVDLPTGRSVRRVLKVQSIVSLIGKKNVFLLLSDGDLARLG